MQKIKIVPVCLILVAAICFAGCTKNNSKYYKDGEADGLAIFSNTGNNVMTCYINGEAWQTRPRLTIITPILFGSSTSYEVSLYHFPVSNTLESVQFDWFGSYQKDNSITGFVSLYLTIPRNTFRRYLLSLQGQQLRIDTSAGNYFMAATGSASLDNKKANGNIYFHNIQIDSIATGMYTGKMSGLFEADFGSGTITKGRFDHVLTQAQIR